MTIREGEILRIQQLRDQKLSYEKISQVTGHSKTTVQKYCKEMKLKSLNNKKINIPVSTPVTISILVPNPNYDSLIEENQNLKSRIKELENK